MARTPTGSASMSHGKFYARVTVAGKRRSYPVNVASLDAAQARAARLNTYARGLEKAGKHEAIETILRDAGAQSDDSMTAFDLFVERVTGGKYAPTARVVGPTFKSLADDWTSGRLHARWPDVVKRKRSVQNDRGRLEKWVFPIVGDIELGSFTMADAEEVMRKLPTSLAGSTRRHVAQLIRRVLQLAEYPVKAIDRSPIRKGFVPGAKRMSQLAYLYRDEDAALMSCEEVSFERRLLWGFLAREGLRISEAVGAPATDDQPEQEPLRWGAFDLDRGTINIVDYKTRERRQWVLSPGVASVLAAVKAARNATDDAPVFIVGELGNLPIKLRRDMKTAGIKRAELFTTVKLGGVAVSRRMRVHDLRATFITHAFAAGKTEAFIMDRSGHDTSADVQRYRRPARHLSELGAAGLEPLCDVLSQPQSVASNGCEGLVEGGSAMRNPLSLKGNRPAARVDSRRHGIALESLREVENGSKPVTPRAVESISEPSAANPAADSVDPVEVALARALDAATTAEQWHVVTSIVNELRARRDARLGVVDLEAARRERGSR